MHFLTDDIRIDQIRPLIPPAILMEEIPLSDAGSETVANGRTSAENILKGKDDRLLVVVGPCSIHDVKAAHEYGALIRQAREEFGNELEIVMRVYFEKPRSRVGWKGLINDPNLDGSFEINKGLRLARRLLVDLADSGVPAGCEFLDTITPQFIADVVCWGAIGARTTESQIHRELASGLSMPVGFKNGTDGNVNIAIDAIHASAEPHHFLSVTKQSVAAIVSTKGNDSAHIILRGANSGPNYSAEDVEKAAKILEASGVLPRVMVDCSHGNSGKDHTKQPGVATVLAEQVKANSPYLFGLMIESNLVGGNQKMNSELVYGQSITDACLAWDATKPVLKELADAIKYKRSSK